MQIISPKKDVNTLICISNYYAEILNKRDTYSQALMIICIESSDNKVSQTNEKFCIQIIHSVYVMYSNSTEDLKLTEKRIQGES